MFKFFLNKCGYNEVQLVKNQEISIFKEPDVNLIPNLSEFEGNDIGFRNVPEEEMTKDERGMFLYVQFKRFFDIGKLEEKGMKEEVWRMMWNERKRMKIRNIVMEKRVDDGFRGEEEWELEINMFSSLQFLQAEAIRNLCFYLEETTFQGYDFPKQWLDMMMDKLIPEVENCRMLLMIRDQREKNKPWSGKRLAKQIDIILKKWGFARVLMDGKKRRRKGKRKDEERQLVSNFKLTFNPIYQCLYHSPSYSSSSSSSSSSGSLQPPST
jgi:hypothetical protein